MKTKVLLAAVAVVLTAVFAQSFISYHNELNGKTQSETAHGSMYRPGIDTILIIEGDKFYLKDLSEVLHFVASNTDSSVHQSDHSDNYAFWRYYLTKPHPSISTMRKYFKEAADEFDVPIHILHAIGQVENNWTQIGPSIDQGWGVMHLVDNNYCQTLFEAAALLDLNASVLKEDARQNIRGAAALLAQYAGPERNQFISYEEWYPAMKKFSGLINDQVRSIQLEEYKRVLHQGSESVTLWGDTIILSPQPKTFH